MSKKNRQPGEELPPQALRVKKLLILITLVLMFLPLLLAWIFRVIQFR